jgi:hypothetical protein
MAFGLWGLKVPHKVGAAVDHARGRFMKVSRVATSLFSNKSHASQNNYGEEYKPVLDVDFVPGTIEEKYKKYVFCMTSSEPCPGFSLDSERAYQLDLQEHMARQLNAYYEFLKDNPWKIQSSDEVFARNILKNSFPELQVVTLKILGLFPANSENLATMTDTLKYSVDDGVLDTGISVLEKYRGQRQFELKIMNMFETQIGQGTGSSAVLAARRVYPFLNDQTVDTLRGVQFKLQRLHSKQLLSDDRLNAVDSALREYQRQ